MKIKNILMISALALTSCDDFLDVAPNSSFTAEEIFASEDETKAMLNTIYSLMTNSNLYGVAWPYTFNTNTDVEMKSSSSSVTTSSNGDEVHCFDMNSSWSSLESTWNKAYECINYCNDFLENIQESDLFSHTIADGSPTNMQQMYGEVRCLRALLYFDLMRTFGDVVFTTKSTDASDDFYNIGTTSRYDIYDRLIADLQDAEKYMLYASQLDETVERASREFCQAFIGQLALYRGGWQLVPGGSKGVMERPSDYLDYYAIAKEYLQKVIDGGRHSLSAETFEDMWRRECNWSVLSNGDVIFEVPMLIDGSGSYAYNVGVTISYDSDNPTHSYGQASNRVTFCGLYPFTFDPRDLRLDMTCVPYSYDTSLNQVSAVGKSCVTGWGIGKWSKMYMSLGTMNGYAGSTGINSIRLRYADVLLMYAEVENELNGPTASAKEALATVRRRAFAAADQAECVDQYVAALTSKDDFFQAIVDERSWEFGGEGIRKYDLARWNIYGKTLCDTYDKLQDWGQRANGLGVLGEVRHQLWYREITNASGRIELEWLGIKEYGDDVAEHPSSEGWQTVSYAANWWTLNSETDLWEVHDDVKWSFRGHVNVNNRSSVADDEVVRYLCPYPTQIITSHYGAIQQQYGYK